MSHDQIDRLIAIGRNRVLDEILPDMGGEVGAQEVKRVQPAAVQPVAVH
jgi:hypothetical protein